MGNMERILDQELDERRAAVIWLAALLCAIAVIVGTLIVTLGGFE